MTDAIFRKRFSQGGAGLTALTLLVVLSCSCRLSGTSNNTTNGNTNGQATIAPRAISKEAANSNATSNATRANDADSAGNRDNANTADGTDNANNANNEESGERFQPILWSANAYHLRDRIGRRFRFDCPPNGTLGVIWGTDVYTSDSSICTAAVHAGLAVREAGGTVTIEMRPGQQSYTGTTQNRVTSHSYPAYSSSFVFVE